MPTLMEICNTLPHLSKQDLEQVFLRCRALMQVAGPPTEAIATPVIGEGPGGWLLIGLSDCLRRRRLPYKMPAGIIQGMKEYAFFVEAAKEIEPWLLSLVADMNRTERLHLSVVAADCLARRISAFMPVSIGTLLRQYYRVPEALEDSFPEYAKNGWFPLIIRRK